MKKFLKAAVLAGALSIAIPAFAQLHVGVGINIGPPAPPAETVIVRPAGEVVWVPGYYRWAPRRHHYVWVAGRWMHPPRPHSVWVAGHWERRNNEWVFFQGRWEREHPRVR
jgi:hypothetical protein